MRVINSAMAPDTEVQIKQVVFDNDAYYANTFMELTGSFIRAEIE